MSKNQSFDRKRRLSVLAKAPNDELRRLWGSFVDQHGNPDHEMLRAPEIGTVMVRGRAGAVGAPFNLGEITVTRCSVRLPSGAVGHGYTQGRDKAASLAAACLDALAEDGAANDVDELVVGPLQDALLAKSKMRASKAAATKVEFFTMVRGEG